MGNDLFRSLLNPLLASKNASRETPQPASVVRDEPLPDEMGVQIGAYYLLVEDVPSQRVASQWLDDGRLPAVDQWQGNGGGGSVSVGRIVIDGNGSVGADEYETASYFVEAGGGQGSLNVGYLLIDTPLVRVYPLVGIGAAGCGLDISPIASNNGSHPRQSGWFAMLLRGGLAVEFTIPLWRLRVYLLLRAGYYLPLFDVIQGEGTDVGHRPRPFFRIALGTGWRH